MILATAVLPTTVSVRAWCVPRDSSKGAIAEPAERIIYEREKCSMQYGEKTALITGAGGGIGFGVAQRILAAGGRVALVDINSTALDKAYSTLDVGCRKEAICIVADSADPETMDRAAKETVDQFGGLHYVVANAGVRMKSTPVTQLDMETWDRIIRTNLRGAFVTLRSCIPHLIAVGGGSIVAISSLSGKMARIDQSAYCASKAAVTQLSRALALELAEKHIRVNAIGPGTVRTPMFELAQAQDGSNVEKDRIYGSRDRFRTGIPLRRIAEIKDIVSTILFLLSDDSRHITGQTIYIDGGESLA